MDFGRLFVSREYLGRKKKQPRVALSLTLDLQGFPPNNMLEKKKRIDYERSVFS